jgi:type IV fimbrial biogenesis protein FimT
MKHRSHGFTLAELMIVLALAAAILAIGSPSFNDFRANNRLTGVANDFLGAIQVARTEAIKRQVSASICPSDDGTSCSTTGSFRGWIAFVDGDDDCVRVTSDNTEPLLRVETPIDSDRAKPIYEVSKGVCISFGSNGFRQTIAGKGTADRTIFCDARGLDNQKGTNQSAARGIEITPTGRARVTRVKDEIGGWSLPCSSS